MNAYRASKAGIELFEFPEGADQAQVIDPKNPKKIAESVLATEQKLSSILVRLDGIAGELSKSDRTYSLNPRKFIQNFKNLAEFLDECITIIGDKSLGREIKRIEKAITEIQEDGTNKNSQSKAMAILNSFVNFLPKLFRAAKAFVEDAAVKLKASHHQVRGYDNFVSKTSKKIWGDIRKDNLDVDIRGVNPKKIEAQSRWAEEVSSVPIKPTKSVRFNEETSFRQVDDSDEKSRIEDSKRPLDTRELGEKPRPKKRR